MSGTSLSNSDFFVWCLILNVCVDKLIADKRSQMRARLWNAQFTITIFKQIPSQFFSSYEKNLGS